MSFLNAYEVDDLVRRHADDLILGAAAVTLQNLRDWTDRNSDGWAYWPKPSRAAQRLADLLTRGGRFPEPDSDRVTAADVRKAYVPIRSFCTRHGAPARDIIVEVR